MKKHFAALMLATMTIVNATAQETDTAWPWDFPQ